MRSAHPVDPETWMAIDRARAEVVEVLSQRSKSLEDEKAGTPKLVEQVEAILAKRRRHKGPKQKPSESQADVLERLEAEGISPKRKPRSLRPAWWSEVEQWIVILRRNLVKDAADKIENEINYEVGGFYSWVTPKAVDELAHYREQKSAEEESARWLRDYLSAPWLLEYLQAKMSEQAEAKPDGKTECGQETVERSGDQELSRASWLGGVKFRIGEGKPFVMPQVQAEVLQAAILLGGSFDGASLEKKAGSGDAARTLRAVRDGKSPLAPFVQCPAGKGKGGYRVDITDDRASGEPRGR